MAEKSSQTLANHTRLDPPFHFVAVPIALLNVFWSAYQLFQNPGIAGLWGLILAIGLLVAVFLIRIYALKVQDRVIRLEERLRMQSLLPSALMSRTSELTEKQFVALRFASDGELASLVESTLKQARTPADIKSAVKNWRPDYFRV